MRREGERAVIVVADAGPPHYLALLGHLDVLRGLFGEVRMPREVLDELTRPATPEPVRTAFLSPPRWFVVPEAYERPGTAAGVTRDRGERAVAALASRVRADLLLCDDRPATAAMRRRGFRVTGTLGLIDRAGSRGLLDFSRTLDRLVGETNFRVGPQVLRDIRAEHDARANADETGPPATA